MRDFTHELDQLKQTYIYAVNAAVESGRLDLAEEIGEEYHVEALRLMTEAELQSSTI